MPNWCANSLTLIAATKEEAQELCDYLSNLEVTDSAFFGFLFQRLGMKKIGTGHE